MATDTKTEWTRIETGHPRAHAKYAVLRDGLVFTATPCYGMHEPWWVVRTMAQEWPNETEPIDMRKDDRWMPIEGFVATTMEALSDGD